jgi:hypothetical protein
MQRFLKWVFLCAMMLALSCSVRAADSGGDKKDDTKKDDSKKEKDPKDMTLEECEANGICPVTRKPSKPIYHYKLGDKEYHFATRDAQKQFAADPEKFGYKKDDSKKDDKK